MHMHTEAKKSRRSKAKLPDKKITSESIAELTTAFLKAGGQITKIQPGVSSHTIKAHAEKNRKKSGS